MLSVNLLFHGRAQKNDINGKVPLFQINNRILALLRTREMQAVIKLSIVGQFVFSPIMITTIYPVKDGWGKTGCMTNWI
jgi:hypothetical protein